MAENSKIEWTDHTFNPWMGCTKVSAGCKNCYAENQMDHRYGKVQWGQGKPRVRTSTAMWRKPLAWNAGAEFFVSCGACGMRSQRRFGGPHKGLSPCPNEECRSKGYCERVRPRVFSASLGDWLDPEVPIEWLADFVALIQATPHLDWLLVTKRPELFRKRMEHVFDLEICENPTAEPGRLQLAWDWHHGKEAPANVWFGVSVEHQEAADARIPDLLKIPAAVRFLSCEPLLGPVDLGDFLCRSWRRGFTLGRYLDWVICGGESGRDARPMHPDWARGLRAQCQAANVPFFFKQWGQWQAVYDRDKDLGWHEVENVKHKFPKGRWVNLEGGHGFHGDRVHWMVPVGKKNAGRLLDGREWNELPEVAHG